MFAVGVFVVVIFGLLMYVSILLGRLRSKEETGRQLLLLLRDCECPKPVTVLTVPFGCGVRHV